MDDSFLSDSDHDTDELEDIPAGAGESEQVDEIPGSIESANCRVFSARELYEKMKLDRIDVEPPYQRDVVWPKTSQSALIDSIFKNKWVPTLLFSQRPSHLDRNGKTVKEKWVCMDGKQRLTSIRLFLDGKIPWYKTAGQAWYFKQSVPPNPSRRIIPDELKEIFLERGLTTAMYTKLTELQERDIFRLVQEGKPLTIGEKMQAAAGPWGEYFDEMTQKYMVNNAKHPNGWSSRITNMKRGADFKTMTSMVLLIRDKLARHPDPPRYLSSLMLQKEMAALAAQPVPERLKQEVAQLLDSFMNISMLAPPGTRWMVEPNTPEAMFAPIIRGRKSMLSPVEMIWIPYMISVHGTKLSTGRLLELIQLLKVDIRKRYPREVKNNTEVTRFVVDWIHNVDPSRLTGCYKGYEVPRPPPSKEDDIGDLVKPKIPRAGASEPPRANFESSQSTQKRRTIPASMDPSLAAPELTFKRPRRAGPQPIPASQQATPRLQSSQSQRSSAPLARPSGTFEATKTNNSIPGCQLATGPGPRLLANALNSTVPPPSRYPLDKQVAAAAERAKAAVNESSPAQGTGNSQQLLAASQPNRSSMPVSQPNIRMGPMSQNGPPRFVPNYPQAIRPTAGFQLPVKGASLYSPPPPVNRPLTPNVMPKLKYNQFAAGDFHRPMADPPHQRLQVPMSTADLQTNELFRMASPNPYAAHQGPAWKAD